MLRETNAAMYDILTKVRDEIDFENPPEKFNKRRYEEAIKECIKRRYVIGIVADWTEDGIFHIAITRDKPKITDDGLRFIEKFRE